MKIKKSKKVSVSRAAKSMHITKKRTKPVATSVFSGEKTRHGSDKKSSFSIYIYWVLIVIFVGTTCYMLTSKKLDNTEREKEYSGILPEETLEQMKDESAPYTRSGIQKMNSGDIVGALNDFTMAIEKNPSAANYVYRGEALMAGENYKSAISDFDTAAKINPMEFSAYYYRALANVKMENLESARLDMDKAIEAYDSDKDTKNTGVEHELYAKHAQITLWRRNWQQALADYTTAISKTAGDLDWNDYTGRAEARMNLGDYEGAVTDYTSAVTIISDSIRKAPDEKTRENMSRQAMGYFEKAGALRVKLGDMSGALQDLEAAHTLSIALDDMENKARLEILISNIRK